MTTATITTGQVPPQRPDPELEALVPRSGRGRTAALIAAIALAVAAAWVSPDVLRGDLPTTGSGAWSTASPHHVVAITELSAPALGARYVYGVRDLPGARVAGAWIAPGSPALDTAAWDSDDPVAEIEEGSIGAERLPAQLPAGTTSSLVVVWEVTDCDALDDSPAVAQVRALFGTQDVRLNDWTGPGSSLTLLRDEGICP